MEYRQWISIDPGVRSGKPCVKGTRITVFDVLDYLAAGMREDEIVDYFPQLSIESIRACLSYSAGRDAAFELAS